MSAADASAAVSGKILKHGSGEPLEGAVMKMALRPDATPYDSAPAGRDGAYALEGLPAGTYDVAVDAGGGLYVVHTAMTLQPGETRQVSLALQEEPKGEEPGGTAEPATPEGETPPPPPEEKKKSAWRKPWVGALVVVGSAVLLGALVSSSDDDDEATASPSD